jgi:dolichol-phosphate mannosyltransferase
VSPSITVVIPTYNEKLNLSTIVSDLRSEFPDCTIVVVDDNSPDGTGHLADELARSSPPLYVVHRPSKSGIGPAYLAGFKAALEQHASVIVAMDADGSHAPADLVRMIRQLDDSDLVIGSRYVEGGTTVGWPGYRKLLSRFGGMYARTILGAPVADLTSGFKAYRRSALEVIPFDRIRSDGYGFQIETTWYVWTAGLRVREVPITFHDRVAGKSKLSRRIILEAMTMVWRLRFTALRSGHGVWRLP